MGLRDQITADLARLIGNPDLTEPCTLYPGDQVEGLPIAVIVGQPSDALVIGVSVGQRDEKRITITADRATLQTALSVLTGTARDLGQGDRLVFACGHAQAGEWRIDTTQPDAYGWIKADAIQITTVRAGDPALLA
jgi:hypothetical protein